MLRAGRPRANLHLRSFMLDLDSLLTWIVNNNTVLLLIWSVEGYDFTIVCTKQVSSDQTKLGSLDQESK